MTSYWQAVQCAAWRSDCTDLGFHLQVGSLSRVHLCSAHV